MGNHGSSNNVPQKQLKRHNTDENSNSFSNQNDTSTMQGG